MRDVYATVLCVGRFPGFDLLFRGLRTVQNLVYYYDTQLLGINLVHVKSF